MPNSTEYEQARRANAAGWRTPFVEQPKPPFFVDVITTPRNDPNIIYDARKINYHADGARSWLAKHSYWALTNGYAVHTAACVEG